jgi:predicted small lipoprotein YifL
VATGAGCGRTESSNLPPARKTTPVQHKAMNMPMLPGYCCK